MPKPEEFSKLKMYGEKEIFEKKVEEGYTEVAYGDGGDWFDDQRIVSLFAFYHPNGKVATYEHPKRMTFDGHTMRSRPFQAEYNKIEFQIHLQEFQIKLEKKVGLEELVKNWEE